MMKFFAILSIAIIAVSAQSYHYIVPKFPCAYKVDVKQGSGFRTSNLLTFVKHGRYAKIQYYTGNNETVLYRADITKTEDDKEMILNVSKIGDSCAVGYVEMEKYLSGVNEVLFDLFQQYNNHSFKNKGTQTYNGLTCDVYYDGNSIYIGGIYVYDGYIIGIRAGNSETTFEYEWDAPMSEFVLGDSNCTKEEAKLAQVPSEQYAACPEEHRFIQPELPCVFKLTIKHDISGSTVDSSTISMNGRYAMMISNAKTILVRPDINKKQFTTTTIAYATKINESCTVQFQNSNTVTNEFKQMIDSLFSGYTNNIYSHKESKKYNGKTCDAYYDGDSIDDGGIYVYSNYIYAIHTKDNGDMVFEYEWDAPLKDFVLEDSSCTEQEAKLAELPSEQYALCPGEYKLVQLSYPCSFSVNANRSGNMFNSNNITLKVNGLYYYYHTTNGDSTTIFRPDITNETGMYGVFSSKTLGNCSVSYVPQSSQISSLNNLINSVNNRTYTYKTKCELNGVQCDCYFNGDTVDNGAVYVVDGFIIASTTGNIKFTMNYSFEKVPMETFKVDSEMYPNCTVAGEKFFQTPTLDADKCDKKPSSSSSSGASTTSKTSTSSGRSPSTAAVSSAPSSNMFSTISFICLFFFLYLIF